MKKRLSDQFQKVVESVSSHERSRNPKLRSKELWLRKLLEGMDQVLNSKIPKVFDAK